MLATVLLRCCGSSITRLLKIRRLFGKSIQMENLAFIGSLSFFGVKSPAFRHGQIRDETPSPFVRDNLLFSPACARIERQAH